MKNLENKAAELGSRLVLLLLLFSGCGEYQQVTKQLPTFANLQTIAQELQRRVENKGFVSAAEAKVLISKYENGLDSWGHPPRPSRHPASNHRRGRGAGSVPQLLRRLGLGTGLHASAGKRRIRHRTISG
jgi:hypothetical protein